MFVTRVQTGFYLQLIEVEEGTRDNNICQKCPWDWEICRG